MKAAILYEANKPLQVVDVEQQGPQAGEARVRVMATGICHSDWHIMNGDWPLPLPMVLGQDVFQMARIGTFCEYVVCPAEMLVPIRKDMPWAQAALMGCCVPTGVGAVTHCAKVEAG